MLALEEQLYDEVAAEGGELQGTPAIGASTGPGATSSRSFCASLSATTRSSTWRSGSGDTQTVSEKPSRRREIELGVVGALRRNRSLEFEPLVRDDRPRRPVRSPPGRGGTVSVDDLRQETVIAMQEGAGVRRVVDEEPRRAGLRVRELEPRLSLACRSPEERRRGLRRHVHLTHGDRGEPAAGTLAMARVEGLEPVRQIYVGAKGRPPTRAAAAFLDFAREKTS